MGCQREDAHLKIKTWSVLLFLWLSLTYSSTEDEFALPPSFSFGENPQFAEYDLTQAVKIPFQDMKTQYIEPEGHDGFPALGFRNGSDVKIAYRQILPESLTAEFSILVSAKPRSRRGGFIFAVVNSYDTVVELGVRIAPDGPGNTLISLYYTDSETQIASQVIANFTVARFHGKWARFAFRVSMHNVTLFFNCNENATVPVKRDPLKLKFGSSSTLYIAQAGPKILDVYEGAIDQLKIYGDPAMASKQCITDFQGFDSHDDEFANEFDDGNIERNDYDPNYKETGGSDGLGAFPPPPPMPDGKECHCAKENCCKYLFNDTQAGSGFRGEKGERGPRGPPGESIRGPPGPPGPPGPVGESAPTGSCACNLTTIVQSIGTSSALRGPPGPPGEPGRQGAMGPIGPIGYHGDRGPMGPPGEKGERGYQGPDGRPGPKGEPGKDGIVGPMGPPGPPGPPGPVEFENVDETVLGSSMVRPGVPGAKGEPGSPGSSGPRGERGPSGPKGSTGDSGSKGERGDRGLPGEKGSQGVKGEAGIPGIDGVPGTPGVNGRPGERGEKGDQGTPGLPGPPGISYREESEAIVPLIAGPKGDRGDRGPKGDKGEAGEAGIPGIPGQGGLTGPMGSKGEQGPIGGIGPVGPPGEKGDRGEPGPPGAVTMPDGNDKILVIKGEKGEMGRRGRRGKPGLAGVMGPPGKPGLSGDIGLPGWMGRPGPPGLPGTPGQKGEKGESSNYGSGNGEKGEKGEKGDRGKDGKDGSPGPPGPGSSGEETRYVPVPGPPGPPGPPGTPGLPGVSITGPKGEPGSAAYGEPLYNLRPGRSTPSPPIFTVPDQEVSTRVARGAMLFQDKYSLIKHTKSSPVGTLAFLTDEESLLIRVNDGWKYIVLGSLLPVNDFTTDSPPFKPQYDSSNLLNQITQPLADSPHLRLAALNTPYTGNMGGLRGADYACYKEARRGGYHGTFRALLTTKTQNIDSLVRQQDRVLPVVNLRGELLYPSYHLLTSTEQPPPQGRIFAFDGRDILEDSNWSDKDIWHGASAGGESVPGQSCDSWRTARGDRAGLAGSLHKVLDQHHHTCDQHLVVLCVESTSERMERRRKRDVWNEDSDKYEDNFSEEEYHHFLKSLY